MLKDVEKKTIMAIYSLTLAWLKGNRMGYQKFDFSLAVDKLKIDWIRPKRMPDLYQNLIQEFNKPNQMIETSEEFQKDLNFAMDFYQNTAVHPEKMLDSLFIWEFLQYISQKATELQPVDEWRD